MPVTFFQTLGALKKFKHRRWAHQETFKTPMKALPLFVDTLVATLEPVAGGTVTIGEVVFDPRNLNALLTKHKIEVHVRGNSRYLYDWSISAIGRADLKESLVALLADTADFLLVPDPARFMLYADHDEFVTILGMARGKIGEVSRKLSSIGFNRQRDYQRVF